MKTILILEDDVDLAMQWKRYLSDKKFNVMVCHTAAEAVAALENNPIDLCVIDFMVRDAEGLPVPDGGLTFLAKLTTNAYDHVKIIAVSGYSEYDLRISARDMMISFGAQRFLQKPFGSGELLAEISRLFLRDT